MKTTIPLRAMAAGMLALFLCAGCEEVHPSAAASHGSRRNYAFGHYTSTPLQIHLARERAEREYAKMSPEKKNKMRAKGVRYLAVLTLDPTPEQLASIKKKKARLSEPGSPASPSPKPWHCVMIWDTYAKDLVGSDCYAVSDLPPRGESVVFDTHVAEYVGVGEY